MADQKQFIEVVSWVSRELASFAHSSRKEIVVALVVAALVSYVLLYFWAEAHQRKRLPPGPWPWPVVGNFPAVRDMPHRALHGLAAKYGGLMYLRLGTLNLLKSFAHDVQAMYICSVCEQPLICQI